MGVYRVIVGDLVLVEALVVVGDTVESLVIVEELGGRSMVERLSRI